MNYKVSVVEDDELPTGTDWAIAREGGRSWLLVKRAQASCPTRMCAVLEEAWAASRAFVPAPSVPLAWWQRRPTLIWAASVAAAVAVAVPSPLQELYFG